VRQLTSLDHQFLALEDDRHVGHVAGLAIVDQSTAPGGDFSCATVKALLRERLVQLPPLRWRVAEVPLNLDYPYWVEDDDFDLDFHVRELALPSLGSSPASSTARGRSGSSTSSMASRRGTRRCSRRSTTRSSTG
jgi:hypothetical protein